MSKRPIFHNDKNLPALTAEQVTQIKKGGLKCSLVIRDGKKKKLKKGTLIATYCKCCGHMLSFARKGDFSLPDAQGFMRKLRPEIVPYFPNAYSRIHNA